MSYSVTLQEVHTHGTLVTQTICELQQLCCVSFSHESWARENYSLCMVYMHANVLCVQYACKHNNICRTYYWLRTMTLYLTVHFTAQPCTNLQLMSDVWLEPPHVYLEEAVQNGPEHQVCVLECRHAATQTLPSH